MWSRIKAAFTRSHPAAGERTTARIRWCSKQSGQWSKWYDIPVDFMSSDPTLPLKMSKGQPFQLQMGEAVPQGNQSRRKRHAHG